MLLWSKTIRIQCRIERPHGPGGCLALLTHNGMSPDRVSANGKQLTQPTFYITQPHFKAHFGQRHTTQQDHNSTQNKSTNNLLLQ